MEQNATRRRWFRFGLRTIFALVTLLCIRCGIEFHDAQVRKSMADELAACGGKVEFDGLGSWHSRWFGGPEVSLVKFTEGVPDANYDLLHRAKLIFPEIHYWESWEEEMGGGIRTYTGKDGEFSYRSY